MLLQSPGEIVFTGVLAVKCQKFDLLKLSLTLQQQLRLLGSTACFLRGWASRSVATMMLNCLTA